jgi:hypothetical protein
MVFLYAFAITVAHNVAHFRKANRKEDRKMADLIATHRLIVSQERMHPHTPSHE